MAFYEEEIVVLIDEDNVEMEFEVIEIFELKEQKYVFLFPANEDDDEAVIMKIVVDADGEDILVDIDNDEEWNNVVEAWEEIIEEIEEEEKTDVEE